MGVNYKGAIENFNPYVSQIPVEAYTKVGMFKQQQEEMGIQKIQSTIDNIAGLDIANQGGKEYLQGRVNELTGTLNKLGGYADMSNSDNIRNLQTLAAPIYQDMNIQTDVANTMQYRALVRDQQEALKSGKAEDFSVAYETMKKIQPWLNSKTAGDAYAGGSRTLRGTYDETRKMFVDEIAKFKPDKYLTQSSASPVYKIQTEKGIEIMDKRRLSEYVMGSMSPDTRELMKRGSWYENFTISDPELIDKTIQTVTNETSSMLQSAQQYSDMAKIHSNNSEMKAYYEQISNDYKTRHDSIISQTKDELSKLNPNKLTEQQKDAMYARLGVSKFANSIAEGLGYTDVTTKELENPVFKTMFHEDQENLRNAVTSKNVDVAPRFDKDGNLLGLTYTNNEHKHDKVDKDGNPIGTGTGEFVDKNGDMIETNVPLIAGPEDKMAWTYPTFDKITDNLKANSDQITTGIYQFLKQANVDADKFFVRTYDKSANGVVGQTTKISVKKGFESQVANLVGALETAVDTELTDNEFTSKIGNSLTTGTPTGDPALTKQLNALTPEMRGAFMPALKYITDDKSGKTYIKQVLEKKKDYANTRASLANVMRKYGEIQFGGDAVNLKKLNGMTDDQLLSYKNESETTNGNAIYQKINVVNGKKYLNMFSIDAKGNPTDLMPPNTTEATDADAKKLNFNSLADVTADVASHTYSKVQPDTHAFFDEKFTKGFNKYLQDNVSSRTENMYSTVFSNMMSKIGVAGKRQLMTAIFEQNGIPASEDLLNSANITIGGYSNTNKDNPLDKIPTLKINYITKDKDNHNVTNTKDINMTALINANQGKTFVNAKGETKKHPFVDLFDAFQYMPEATSIMMDPYHGSRLNDDVKNWNIISDNKGNKALKYRIVWTGDDIDPKQVGTDANIPDINQGQQAYVELYVPGKGKVLLKNPTSGSTQSFSHPALALKWLHDTWELRPEKELDDFYKYLAK